MKCAGKPFNEVKIHATFNLKEGKCQIDGYKNDALFQLPKICK